MDKFDKILVARFSPENGCHVPDDEILIVLPRKIVPPKKNLPHYFVSARDPKRRSAFGWVREASPFNLHDFIREHLHGREVSAAEREHLLNMFSSITNLPVGTAVGADYFVRGVIEKQTVLSIHKVSFYPASQ